MAEFTPSSKAPMFLNATANYNEKTVTRINLSVSKKFNIGLPENGLLNFSEWNHNTGYIAAGGAQGLMRVVKIGSDASEPAKSSGTLVVNQTLEGHSSSVINASWNENHQKLTTSDTSGLIIVWGIFNDQWFEEMINNRNKSVVVGICWNRDGTKIAIAYADGSVIVGTLDGNRIWNKELDINLVACEWAPEHDMLIFGTTDGKVVVYDTAGELAMEIQMVCLESVELEQALAKTKNEEIVCMQYWSPTLRSKAVMDEKIKERERENEERERQEKLELTGTAVFNNIPKPPPREEEPELPQEPIQPIPPDRPRFFVAYSRGIIQMMRSLSDPKPSTVVISSYTINAARWSPNGAFFGVCGVDSSNKEDEHASLLFYTAYGQCVGYFRITEVLKFNNLSWEGSGLRMTIATDHNLIIANIRPDFKWGSMDGTVVYVYQKDELAQYGIMFYDIETDEKTIKIVPYFENMAFHKDYCLVVSRQVKESSSPASNSSKSQDKDDSQLPEEYFCQLCNTIGTSLDYNITRVRPKFACVNGMAAVIASEYRFFIWHFVLPKYNTVQAGIHVPGKSAEYILEEQQRPIEYGTKRLLSGTKDEIVAMCIGDTFFLIAMKIGGIYRVSLADGVFLASYPGPSEMDSMKLNCNSTRLALVVRVAKLPFCLSLYDFVGPDNKEWVKRSTADRKEIWEYEWDTADENTLAFKEKSKLFIYDGKAFIEQTTIYGSIVSFENLVVKVFNLEKALLTPENPPKKSVMEVAIKTKQEVMAYLSSMKISEAIQVAEKYSHDELWSQIAKYALFKHNYDAADHAFVRLGDYAGVHLIKKLRSMQNEELQKAEIHAHDGNMEKARKLFVENDRKDLAIEWYKKYNEYNFVYDMIKNDGDKEEIANCHRHIAESYYEQLEWEDALTHYEQCDDVEMQIKCLVNGNNFSGLEILARNLPDTSKFFEIIGDSFTTRGMCDQATEFYLRGGFLEKALHACMELNQWQKAHYIAETNHMSNVEGLFGKYTVQSRGVSDEKSVSALALCMRGGRNLEAAKLAFDIAKDRQEKYMDYDDLKKCYVLGGILVEKHRNTMKELKKMDKNNVVEDILDDEASMTADESRIFENTWRGAEAFHFVIMAQQHFFADRMEEALQTSLVLTDYEEFLDPAEIYSMIALASANVHQFGVCSKAMMRLETLAEYDESEKEEMQDLSLKLFTEHPPVNPNSAKVSCPTCDTKIDPFDQQCYHCFSKFPICIASGKLIKDNVFWLCPRCKHRAHQDEIIKFTHCPLCHDVESFRKN